ECCDGRETAVGSSVTGQVAVARAAEAGIEPSVGSVGDSYDNALAQTLNGLYKADVIHRRRPWRRFEAAERPRMARLGQQPPPPRADRDPPSCRGRSRLLCPA